MRDRPVFSWAAWTSLNTGMVSLKRDWRGRVLPRLLWGEDRLPLAKLNRAPRVLFAEMSGYYCENQAVHFLVRPDRYPGLDLEANGVFVAGSFNGWGDALGKAEWKLSPTKIGSRQFLLLERSERDLPAEGDISFKFVTGRGHWLPVPDDAPNVSIDGYGNRNYHLRRHQSGGHLLLFTTPRSFTQTKERVLIFQEDGYEETVFVQPGVFLKSLDTSAELGARVGNGETVFRLFAPQASAVQLFLFYKLDEDSPSPIDLYQRGIVWEARVPGNRHGWFYYYRVDGESLGISHFDPHFRVLDPYALAAVGAQGPGIVWDTAKLPRPKKPHPVPPWEDLVVLEAHVRDLTAHAPLSLSDRERRGFVGLRKWVEHPDFYPSTLGVNAIELQPIQLFDAPRAEDYHWGYMPVSYFSPASQYALDPAKGSQIAEFAALVEALHKRGFTVILDVVYNHVGEPNYLQYLDKQYYFLLSPQGDYLNYSGTGNTLDAQAPLVRRLMLDSLRHLVETYDVDGFRFDLGELLGKEALSWLQEQLEKVKPGLVFVAEPWSFRGHIARDLRETNIASWNDSYREYLARYVRNHAPADGLLYHLRGSPELTRFPSQTVNYVESHDDFCWIDKITEHPDNRGDAPTLVDRKRTHLMVACLMMSLGQPLLNSGMDFLKSKQGVHNTYLRGDLNALPYDRLVTYSGTHDYFRAWIDWRLSEAGRLVRLRETPPDSFYRATSQGNALAVLLNADGSHGPGGYLFAINPSFEPVSLALPEGAPGRWVQIADHERFDPKGLLSARTPWRDGQIHLPVLSCALWQRESHGH